MKVLFVCYANIGRSQIATAFFNKLSKKHHAVGAGTHVFGKEGGQLHELVVKSMAELSYDLSKNTTRQLTPRMAEEADKIVVMTEKEKLPNYVNDQSKLIFWNVKDAKGRSYEFHCKVRDQIKGLVENLVKELEP